MNKKLLVLLYALGILCTGNNESFAQSKLIYFWTFNGYTSGTTYHLPTIPAIPADYNVGTTTAQMYWEPAVTVSGSYASYCDISAAVTADFDTVNNTPISTYSVTTGNYFRARNPSDSMQLVFSIPSTGYQNITIRYGTETSSITSGDSAQIYSYSLDGGTTWNTVGLSTPATVLNTATWDTFRSTQVTITDPAAANDPNLQFKIVTLGRNHTTSGNNRFDNISIKGDTILPSGTLIHFWDFNTFAGTYTNPNFPYLNPDYTIHPYANAYVHMGLFPGTSLANPTYFDEVSATAGSTDYDTVNEIWSAIPVATVTPTSNPAIRTRNPQDSDYLYYYMPTTNYKNIILKYATESSSLTSGDSIQLFNYSIDSGATWRISGISEAWDSAWTVGMPTGTFGFRPTPITIYFSDPASFNCTTLFFRIHEHGRSSSTSGNNRFDNISVQGDSILSPLPTITTTVSAFGPYCNTVANSLSVPFTTTGAMGDSFLVQISNQNGTFPANVYSNIIGYGKTSPISATIPSSFATGSSYRVRVVTNYPLVYGSDNGSNITVAGVAGPISGTQQVCISATTSLTESGSGTWTSSNTTVATVGTSGTVSGLLQGTTTITFSVGPGCNAYATITVNPLPAVIGGSASVCIGSNATYTDGTSSGYWTSGAVAVGSIGSASGIITGITAGTTIVTYTIPTGCMAMLPVIVNTLPSPITGTTVFCQGSTTGLSDVTTGGTWSSGSTLIATVGTTGVVTGVSGGAVVITYTSPLSCIATNTITVNPLPLAITGGTTGCIGTTTDLSDLTAFGAWSSSSTGVASIGSSTGVVTGIGIGTTIITYKLSTGCYLTELMSINTLPSGITGVTTICAGTATSLSDVTPGGTWSSSNTAIATVGMGTGSVASIMGGGGNPVITYLLPTGCGASVTLSVNASPATIAGPGTIYCVGDSISLSDIGGGTWTSGATAIATVNATTGEVTAVAVGGTNITYTLADGCQNYIAESVVPGAAPISGTANLCNGSSYNYTDETAYGVWSSSNSGVAQIGSGDGIITAEGAGTAIITYGLSVECTTTTTITVNPLPTSISGTTNVCLGLSTPLSDAGSGTWSASDSYLASVGSTSGIVTGLVASILQISYTLPTGCSTFTSFTVNPNPAAITGTDMVCVGLATALSETTTGGNWMSSDNTLASVDGTGMVTGVGAGAPGITYMLPTGCIASVPFTVNPLPDAISGTPSVCMGSTTALSDDSTGGSWTSGSTSMATVDPVTGIVTGVLTGNPMITYTLSTGCIATTMVTVNPSYAIGGGSVFCTGLTNVLTDAVSGGTWASSNTTIATIGAVSGSMNSLLPGNTSITYMNPFGCSQSETITVINLPDPISGASAICLGNTTTLTDAGGGGWYSSNPAVAYVGFGTGIVSGLTAGTAIITYSLGTSCINTTFFAVNPIPDAIAGIMPVCQSSNITLTDDSTGGSWASANTAVATIDPVTGIVAGIAMGTSSITYMLPTGCWASNVVVVNPISPVSGSSVICQTLGTMLTDAVAGGYWTSSNTSTATIGSSDGSVLAMNSGTTVIAYTIPGTGCFATLTMTVNPEAANTGMASVCQGLNTTLSNMNTGGTWMSSNTAISTIDPVSGIITGAAAGTDTIMYMLSTGCTAATSFTVNPLPGTITGLPNLCTANTYPFTDAATGGSWMSSNTAVVTIDATTGMANALTIGNAMLTYTLPTSCIITTNEVVNGTPEAILGLPAVCVGRMVTYTDTGMGTWNSSNIVVATITTSGIATGLAGGTTTVSYTAPDGCVNTTLLTVNPVAAISGTFNVCTGLSTILSNPVSGGSWSGSNTMLNTVNASTGSVLGLEAGTDSIVYTLPTGCFTWVSFSVNATPAIYGVSGGGSYCAGGTGVTVILSGSQTSVAYQLYDTVAVGGTVSGTGSSLTFGPEAAAGRYNVVATDTNTACVADMTGTALITIMPVDTTSISVSNGIGDTVCQGEFVTYTATGVNGGTSPVFFWTLNGTTTSVFSDEYNIYPNNGDRLTVTMISFAPCASQDTVSQTVVIAVDSVYAPMVSLVANPGFNIKPGESDTLKALTVGAGPHPTYQWYINGMAVSGANSATYFSSTLSNSDSVTCIVKGSGICGVDEAASAVMNVSALGINNLNNAGNIRLFPNPNNGTFTLTGSLNDNAANQVTLSVTDMLGQVVYTSATDVVNGAISAQIKLPEVANGMYLLNLTSGTTVTTIHFVVGE